VRSDSLKRDRREEAKEAQDTNYEWMDSGSSDKKRRWDER